MCRQEFFVLFHRQNFFQCVFVRHSYGEYEWKKKQARRLNRIKITNKQKVNPDGISIFVFLSCCCCCCFSFVEKNLYKLIKKNLSNNNSSNKLICECESKHFAETEMQKKTRKHFKNLFLFHCHPSIHSSISFCILSFFFIFKPEKNTQQPYFK